MNNSENTNMNQPAVSAQWAMQEYSAARDAERSLLISKTPLSCGCTVVDIQAAGGYLADGVDEMLQGEVEIICIEPTKALNQRLNPKYKLVEDKIEQWPNIPSGCVDVVLGLAGLHHSNNQQATVDEAYRVLKPNGCCSICDVRESSAVALWLNEYVHNNSSNGHIGHFLRPSQLSNMMEKTGFNQIDESVEKVPWVFQDEGHLARFFKGFFALKTTLEDIQIAIPRYFEITSKNGSIAVNWELIYGIGYKPRV